MIGATAFSLWKARHDLGIAGEKTPYLLACAASFLSALACVRWFLRYVFTPEALDRT